jgi:hypothetical protein
VVVDTVLHVVRDLDRKLFRLEQSVCNRGMDVDNGERGTSGVRRTHVNVGLKPFSIGSILAIIALVVIVVLLITGQLPIPIGAILLLLALSQLI